MQQWTMLWYSFKMYSPKLQHNIALKIVIEIFEVILIYTVQPYAFFVRISQKLTFLN